MTYYEYTPPTPRGAQRILERMFGALIDFGRNAREFAYEDAAKQAIQRDFTSPGEDFMDVVLKHIAEHVPGLPSDLKSYLTGGGLRLDDRDGKLIWSFTIGFDGIKDLPEIIPPLVRGEHILPIKLEHLPWVHPCKEPSHHSPAAKPSPIS